jgi:hypothetical protein
MRVLTELNRHGIAMTTVDELLGPESCYEELNREVEALKREWSERIMEARDGTETGEIGRKAFMLKLLGERPRLNPLSIYARFALQPQILNVANAYFGMFTRLRYHNVWYTLTHQGPPRESQLWHHDREDHLILKIFVYLSEVDDGAGPFVYAPGTHEKGRLRIAPDSFDEHGVRRCGDEQMGRVVPPENWTTAMGPKGTMVFADTRGYHKGGLAREHDRILYTCMFTSPTSQAPELFERSSSIDLPVNKAQALALTGFSRNEQAARVV